MATIFSVSETIISTSPVQAEAVVSSSLQTWSYRDADYAKQAFDSVCLELQQNYPQENDGTVDIIHTTTTDTLTITMSEKGTVLETMIVQLRKHTEIIDWFQSLHLVHEQQVKQRFLPQPTNYVIFKSLVSGISTRDDEGITTSLQTWTYDSAINATEDFNYLIDEVTSMYPQGMHDEGFAVSYSTQTAQSLHVNITQDGDDYETIVLEQIILSDKSLQSWWQQHEQQLHHKLLIK